MKIKEDVEGEEKTKNVGFHVLINIPSSFIKFFFKSYFFFSLNHLLVMPQTQTTHINTNTIFPFFINSLYLFSLYICRLKGQEVSIKGVCKHHTSTTPLAEQYPDQKWHRYFPTLRPTPSWHEYGRRGKMHKCPDSIHKTLSYCQWPTCEEIYALQRRFPFLVHETKFDIHLSDFMPSSDAIICFFPSFEMCEQ